jgi:hypothetical protein
MMKDGIRNGYTKDDLAKTAFYFVIAGAGLLFTQFCAPGESYCIILSGLGCSLTNCLNSRGGN